MRDEDAGLRHGYADLDGVRLHYVEAGEGPLVVLLHGFPEFWFEWRHQIPALAQAGFRVVAPDMRGYNLSSRPEGVAAYAMSRLTGDVRDLIAERGAPSALLAGHDWGAAVAWATAMAHPQSVERLAILNVPHTRQLLRGLRTLRQLRKSWYMFFFQLPWLPERVLARNGWAPLRQIFRADARPGAFTPSDIERYVEAWSRPGAMTAMINYYRAAFRTTPGRAAASLRPLPAPTLVIWGRNDSALGLEMAEPDRRDVPNLDRVEYLDASHWVAADLPDTVNRLLIDFFSAGR
jgi:pimeloyl-ACP methyl ester carboxylesterase